MTLPVLLALVVGGIAGIAAILHLMGLTTPYRFSNGHDAISAWEREVPERPATGFHLSSDSRASLVTFEGGVGIVWSFGGDTVARLLGDTPPQKTQNGLRFDFPDFGSSALKVRLKETDLDIWMKALEAQ
ncbi:hypothetical protein shim_22870 [Shimia sp. SK013]|uniref:hypothetical protein n=1 Tax=Shimia sp. SK013 TaxID=1389006 RepID=UPI0006B40A81|nr:hypothetical protein [Shimia sp. SK013]KPA21580.1 hypothetical protein shim_22870 [Shimia sp. SK013]